MNLSAHWPIAIFVIIIGLPVIYAVASQACGKVGSWWRVPLVVLLILATPVVLAASLHFTADGEMPLPRAIRLGLMMVGLWSCVAMWLGINHICSGPVKRRAAKPSESEPPPHD